MHSTVIDTDMASKLVHILFNLIYFVNMKGKSVIIGDTEESIYDENSMK